MKKNIIVYLTTFIISVLLFAGCSKKDDPKPKTNSFTVSGKTYDTPKASVAKYGYINTFSGAFMVALNSSSLDFKIDSLRFNYSNGVAQNYHLIVFYLRPSLTATSLKSGKYNINTSAWEMACYGGEVTTNNDVTTASSEKTVLVLTGSVDVNKIDDTNYEFTYDFNLKDQTHLTGYYKGTVATGTFNYKPQ